MNFYTTRIMLLMVILLSSTIATALETNAAPPGSDLRLVASNGQEIILEFTAEDVQAETVSYAGQIYDRLVIQDTSQTTSPGAPQVPTRGTLVGLPTTQGVTVQVLDVETERRRGYRLAPAPVLRLPDTILQNLDSSTLQATIVPDPDVYTTSAFYPGELIKPGARGYLRDQAVVPVQFFPVQYNPVTGEVLFYQRIRVQLTWDSAPALATTPRENHPAYENLLRTTLLNYADLERSASVARPPSAGQPRTAVALRATTPALKLHVAEDGIYKLTPDALRAAGFDLEDVDLRTIRITNHDTEIPILLQGETDGRFDADDYLLFYGVALDDMYTGTNVYWLTAGGEMGLRMPARSGMLAGSTIAPSSFPATLHVEENSDYWRAMPDGAGQDHWFWGKRFNVPESRDYILTLNNIAQRAEVARVRVRLQGRSDVSANPDHRTRIYLNGTMIDDQSWEGLARFEHDVLVPHSYLREGRNTLTLESVDLPDVRPNQLWVNWIAIDYRDTYVAEDDQLRFGVPDAGEFRFEVTNFSRADIAVFDITNPANVTRITNGTPTADDERYTLRFEDSARASTRYLALTAAGYKSPAAIELDQPSSWRSPANGADYIIITHADFTTSAQRLATHRSAVGLQVALVEVHDIYDEFNGGIFNPQAIRDFLAYAYENWDPAPTFVLLVGDAYWDYRNYLSDTPNYVPTQTVQTEILGDTPSDNWFVAVSGPDILPDMFIGRLAVETSAQADAIVDKLIAYDKDPPDATWNRNVLLVADDDNPLFAEHSEAIVAHLPPDYREDNTIRRVYVGDYPPGDPTVDVSDFINAGSIVVNYNGHGGVSRWGHWDNNRRVIFDHPEVVALDNGNRLPVVTIANCLNGLFTGTSDQVSLAEALQRLEYRGAVAVLAATGLDYPSRHRLLMGHFYNAIFQRFQRMLGVASTEAKLRTYAQDADQGDLVEMFVLFGDPATQIGIPVPAETATLSGPTTGVVNTAYAFTAMPGSTTQPTRYTWEATDQTTVINEDGGTEDTVIFTWDTPGEKTISVTVTNVRGTATTTHTIVIDGSGDGVTSPTPEPGPEPRGGQAIYLPLVIR